MWPFGGNKREAELSKALESAQAELASVKSAAEALLVSPNSYDGTSHKLEYRGARELLAAYHGWTFVAVKAIASRLAAQPITLSRVVKRSAIRGSKQVAPNSLEPIDQHPLLDLLHDPNEISTRWTFAYATAANILLSGRGFWWLTAGDDALELYWLPSSWIVGYVGGSRYEGWEVRPPGLVESFTVPAEEMTYFHLPDPADIHGAVSPLRAVSAAVCADDEILRSQVAGFKNGIFPRHALVIAKNATVDGKPSGVTTLNGPQRRQLIDAVRQIWGGAMRSQEPLIIGDGLLENVIKLSANPNEMDWTESTKGIKARILQAFAVNPIVVGEIESANRASSLEAERHLCNNAVNPLAAAMSQCMTAWLCPVFADDGEKLILTIEPIVPRDEELEIKRYQLLAQFGAVEINELRQWAGLPPLDYGDVAVTASGGGVADAVGKMIAGQLAAIGSQHLFNGNGKSNDHQFVR